MLGSGIFGRFSNRSIRVLLVLIVIFGLYTYLHSSIIRPGDTTATSLEELCTDDLCLPETTSTGLTSDETVQDLGSVETNPDSTEDAQQGETQFDLDKETNDILSSLEIHRQQVVGYNEEDYGEIEKRLGMKRGTLPKTPSEYYTSLSRTNRKWFKGSFKSQMEEMIRRFEKREMGLEGLERKITSTDKDGVEGVPSGFEIWGEVATRSDGWEVDVLDDQQMEARIRDWASEQRIEGIWDKLDFPVLKTDLIRYLVLLNEGGIYTDSDTVPRAHPFEWGKPATDKTDSMISTLDTYLTYLKHLHELKNTNQRPKSTKTSTISTIENIDINVIISLEDNRWDENDQNEWSGGTEIPYRRISFCQWTMMAKKGHPVFLDVVGRVLDNLESAIEEGKLDGSVHATQLTGPAVFTDAVFRYLLVQHGITPQQLVELKTRQAVRIGDIVIYGPGSFGPMYKTRNDHVVGDLGMPVGHMYKSRWKGKGWD